MSWNDAVKDAETSATDFTAVDEGKYVVKLTDSTMDSSKSGEEDDPYVIKVEYTITSGKFEKRKLWQNFRFNTKSIKWLQWQLGLIGAWSEAKECKDQKEAAFKTAEFIFKLVEDNNAFFRAEVSHREYNGKTYSDVKIEQQISGPVKTENSHPPGIDPNEEIPF